MTNLPNIMPLEVAAVGGAVLLLCVVPAVLSWTDGRRRRRLAAQQAAREIESSLAVSEVAAEQKPEPAAALPYDEVAAVEPPAEPVGCWDAEMDDTTLAAPQQEMAAPEVVSAAAPPVAESVQDQPRSEPVPLQEPARYPFQLQDLRRVRLRDWPPAAVRTDPERSRVWREAEQVAQEHESAISSAPLSASYPMQSSCLGAAEAEGSKFRLRFLLFPVLWPVTEDQAPAEAVFEVDRAEGVLRSWVEVRRKAEQASA
jgi:hypothetical protein